MNNSKARIPPADIQKKINDRIDAFKDHKLTTAERGKIFTQFCESYFEIEKVDPPLSPDEKRMALETLMDKFFKAFVEGHAEAVQDGMLAAASEHVLIKKMSEVVAKKMLDGIMSEKMLAAFASQGVTREDIEQAALPLLEIAFYKGSYMNHLMTQKGIVKYDDLFDILVKDLPPKN